MEDKKASLLLVIHSHQPVGNFDHVFEKAFRDCYAPFIEMLEDFPHVRATLHYSGSLLEWIEDHEPSFVDKLKVLAARKQIEILGGGYYEPILSAIPEHDAVLQVRSFSTHIKDIFGAEPRGIWLAERVWDPCLPKLLARADVKYSLVDDSQFIYAGIPKSRLRGRYVAERDGYPLSLFPIDMKLRYWIPFHEPEETISYLESEAAKQPGFTAVYGDDGEKFGLWPGTREWVYDKGWLKRFFGALLENREWLRLMTLGEYYDQGPPSGRVFIPPASYEEMMTWALPPELSARLEKFMADMKKQGTWDELAPLVRGASWDNFLVRYPESNRMHKRMLRLSEKVRAAEAEGVEGAEEARRHLFRAQCNCAYWHGVFGGIYMGHLRHAVYENLITADAMIEKKRHPATWLIMDKTDFNRDGREELLVETEKMCAYVDPATGGSLLHLEYKPVPFCLTNLMARRPEAYHEKLKSAGRHEDDVPKSIHERMVSKEAGLEKHLVYDRFARNSFLDHFFTGPPRVEHISRENYWESGDFADGVYEVEEAMGGRRMAWISLKRTGRVDLDGRAMKVEIQKSYGFESRWSGFGVEYDIINHSNDKLECNFAVELNFTLLAGADENRYYRINGEKPASCLMNSMAVEQEVEEMAMVDEAGGFHMEMFFRPGAASLLRFPLETISQSESGFERVYQGSVIWAVHPLEIEPGDKWHWQFIINIEKRV